MARCAICRKPGLRCGCWDLPAGEAEKTEVKVTNKRTGKVTTKTVATGNTVRNGIVWCGACKSRVNNGTCSNARCSTRR